MKNIAKNILAQSKKLRVQLFLAYFLAFSLFLIVTMFVVLFVIQNLMIDQVGASRLDVLRQIAERANTIKTSSTTITNLYRFDPQVQAALQEDMDETQKHALCNALNQKKALYDVVFENVGIAYEIVLLGEDFHYASETTYYSYDRLRQQLWFRKLQSELAAKPSGNVKFVRAFLNDFSNAASNYVFGTGSLLRCKNGTCTLLLMIDEKQLENLYRPAMTDGNIYIFDKDGFIVSHTDKKMLGKQFASAENMQRLYGKDAYAVTKKCGEEYLLSTYYDAQTGWTIVEEIPGSVIFADLQKLKQMIGTALCICLLIAMAISLYMSRRVARPLAKLGAAMDAFAAQSTVPSLAHSSTEEIAHLQQSFYHMADEIGKLMDDIEDKAQQKRLLEMSFLRAQINPHFLYNTLFSIRCLVELQKNEQAMEMLSAFTDLLRLTLSVETTTIPLHDELESTRKYLVLQQIRYGEQVEFAFDISEDTLQCAVPPLILQPIVENAIFHGIEAKKTAGMVVVSAVMEHGTLLLSVTDDGVGMDAQTLAALRQKTDDKPLARSRSIGLANVNNRLKINYGAAYGLQIESGIGIGTTVWLRMPGIQFSQEDKKK
ncbi:MAG: sensor histidine kinase [Ruthenibacterium sp.]